MFVGPKSIAIIDSGIGGISILKQLIEKFNFGNYIYFADNLNLPYGNKSKEFILKRTEEIINILNAKYNIDKIIVACNTASTCIDANKYNNVYTLKFDANKVYLATNLTKLNLSNYNIIPTTKLASIIEKNIFNKTLMNEIIKHYIISNKLYTYREIVLGCTHFELVKNHFEKNSPNTSYIKNSNSLIKELTYMPANKELNVVLLMSKQSNSFYNKFYKILNN